MLTTKDFECDHYDGCDDYGAGGACVSVHAHGHTHAHMPTYEPSQIDPNLGRPK